MSYRTILRLAVAFSYLRCLQTKREKEIEGRIEFAVYCCNFDGGKGFGALWGGDREKTGIRIRVVEKKVA